MTHYNVLTPVMTEYYQDEPPEDWQDYVSVDATDKRDAKRKAVKVWQERDAAWIRYQRADNASPFTGLTADKPLCEHGVCWCDICADDPDWVECEKCLAAWTEDRFNAEKCDPVSNVHRADCPRDCW